MFEYFEPHYSVNDDPVACTPPLLAGHVGVRHFSVSDKSRPDIDGAERVICGSVFYPSRQDGDHARIVDILEPRVEDALAWLAREVDPSLRQGHIDATRRLVVQSVRDAAPLPGTFPVLISYPAGTSDRLSNVAACETIAATGYIVVTIDAPRDAPLIVLPDGKFVMPPMGNDESYIWPRIADIKLLLDSLEAMNATGPLSDCLDCSHIGIFGHSRGGYLANIAAVEDTRIKAAVNIDGFLWGLWTEGTGLSEYPDDFQTRARAMRTPVMRIVGDQSGIDQTTAKFDLESADFGGDFELVSIADFDHSAFSSTPFLSGQPARFGAALSNIARLSAQANVLSPLVRTFFDRTLKGWREPPDPGDARYIRMRRQSAGG